MLESYPPPPSQLKSRRCYPGPDPSDPVYMAWCDLVYCDLTPPGVDAAADADTDADADGSADADADASTD